MLLILDLPFNLIPNLKLSMGLPQLSNDMTLKGNKFYAMKPILL